MHDNSEWAQKLAMATEVSVGIVLLGAVARLFWARWAARGHRPVGGRVISVRREEDENKVGYVVHSVYEIPGHGPLTHSRNFETEGQAILFSRLHKEGSVHKVVVNPADSDKVFLWDELGKTDWNNFIYLFMALATLGAAIYGVMEYFDD
ncbi:hypothetical protein BWI17_17495 [Betaproteobacteria bacterium GR16-43]|nr:hypothetical protein BWI17_17495 [Betaproteobacteria bacterium GR16-43]